MQIQLVHDLLSMGFNRLHADIKRGGHLPRRSAFGNKLENLSLPPRNPAPHGSRFGGPRFNGIRNNTCAMAGLRYVFPCKTALRATTTSSKAPSLSRYAQAPAAKASKTARLSERIERTMTLTSGE